MKNFIFYNPVKVVFGEDQIKELIKLIPAKARVLMTYGGGSIKKNGVYEQVKLAIGDLIVAEFAGIMPNPEYSYLLEAVKICQDKQIDFILAVGGGSVVDATKFIAAAVNYPLEDKWQIVAGHSDKIINSIPFGVVLTLPATGSEMNQGSVISYKEKGKKKAFGHESVFPKFAILDPNVTYSLDERQLANGIVDPFIHVTEQYITTDLNTQIQDKFAQSVLITLTNVAKDVITKKPDYNTRANWMWAATNALNGILSTGTDSDWATHMIGHELTALYNLDHAQTLAIIAPQIWRYKREQKIRKLLKYARNVWQINTTDIDKAIEEGIVATENFFNEIGMKTKFSQYGLTIDADLVAKNVIDTCNGPIGEHKDIEYSDIVKILTMAN